MLSLKLSDFSGTRLIDSRNILALFYASWCPFCRSFLGIFESTMIRKTNPQGALVDISDENNPLWETFKVDIVPTLIGFRDGVTIVRKDGVAGAGLGATDLQDALRKLEKR
jgi:thioredoxin 1